MASGAPSRGPYSVKSLRVELLKESPLEELYMAEATIFPSLL